MRLAAWAALAALGLGLVRRRRPRRIVRISRVVAELDQSEAFYRDGLGFKRVGAGRLDPAVAAVLLPGATAQTRRLRLGAQEIELVRWDRPGPAYPLGSRSNDLWFQHLAIVTGDMDAAYARLLTVSPSPISTDGPQTLPPSGVVAYKFRDPDGHPLELIHFPPGQGLPCWQQPGLTLGIDHSALAVASTEASLRFYRRLGFRKAGQTENHGPAQAALDGLPNARATVTSLRFPGIEGPGLELLAYHPPGRAAARMDAASVVTDWVTLSGGHGTPRLRRDPDGHLVLRR